MSRLFGFSSLYRTALSFAGMLRRVALFTLVMQLCLLSGCVYLPRFQGDVESQAIAPLTNTRIAQAMNEDPGSIARAMLISDPDLALASRVHMIEAAELSIDLQYFIWNNDFTGILLIEKLLQAADRGVRIRALVDDIQLSGLIDRISALNDHPNIEVRIFNPFSLRMQFPFEVFRLAEFALDGNRLNHRMHNKLLVADNQLAIFGGRNIGDEYFGQSDHWNFVDTDILLSGPVIPQLSQGFDTYWNSRWAYPVQAITDISLFSLNLDQIRGRIQERLVERPDLAILVDSLSFSDTLNQLRVSPRIEFALPLIDDPSVSWFQRPDEMAAQLSELTAEIRSEVLIATPYLVPTANLLDIAQELVERGVRITVLTNSLATNNHVTAHAAYSQFRRRILELGINLYEMREDAAVISVAGGQKISMHSKYVIFDDEAVFVGSLNLDPRSLYLNTELGVILQSPELAGSLRSSFNEMLKSENSYRLVETADGLQWHSDSEVIVREPARSNWQRFAFRLLRLLPLSSQL